ncbi:type IV pilus modification PilV family protein [Paraglaciecola aestuariivivens]
MKGFTLIEVLIASLIIMLGVTGYVTLQSQYVRSDVKLNLRNVAIQLGQEKLDDLRQFTQLETTAGAQAYNDIANNQGGDIAAGNVDIALTADDTNTYTFNRSWTVSNQYFVDTDANGTPDTWVEVGDPGFPVTVPIVAGQKAVSVTISWTDNEGDAKSMVFDANIAPVPMGNSYQATNESDSAKTSPNVNYTPGQAPDVIAYELGNGEKVETSKPVPEINNRGDNNIVQFETIKYIELSDATEKLEQEEFLNVNCSCTLAGVGDGLTPAMTVLVDGKLTIEKGQTVTKMTGVVADSQQPDLCNQCCANHHDTTTMVTEETYYRLENGAAHKHYDRLTNGTYALASSVGDDYDEICRFKRIDGYFTLYPDWQLLDIIEFPSNYLFSEANLSAYTGYTEGVIEAEIEGNFYPTRPSGRDLEVAPGGYQLISRGIYLDRMKSSHLAEVQAKLTAGDSDWKAITPFYDINLSLLSNWSSSNTSVATVTQEPIASIVDPTNDYYGTYSRGRVGALSDGSTVISSQAYGHNASITGTYPVSQDEVNKVKLDDSLTVTVNSKASSEKFYGLIGDINCLITVTTTTRGVTSQTTSACETNNNKKSNYVDLSGLSIIPTPSQFVCTVTIPNGKATPFFSCEDVSENWTGDIDFALSVPGSNSVALSVQYPDGSVVNSSTMNISTALSGTSSQEYNLIIEIDK